MHLNDCIKHLADSALLSKLCPAALVVTYDAIADAYAVMKPRSADEAEMFPLRERSARAAAAALREADAAQMQFASLLRALPPAADPRQADGITQDSDGPEYDIPPGLFEVLRRDHEEYSAGRSELGLRSMSLRQFVAAMTAGPLIRTREAIASAIAIAEQEAGLMSQAVS